ncbi:MAG: SWIM zinc finger family protein [Saprospiraceae bacterium]
MSIHVDTFEDDIHRVVTELGKNYFDEGKIIMLKQTSDGWTATVEGSETYHVLLEGHDAITTWQCTCPFEHGPVCKHIAAVLYAVRDNIKANRASSGGDIDRWIEDADIETLRRILKIEVRRKDGAMSAVYHEMNKSEE